MKWLSVAIQKLQKLFQRKGENLTENSEQPSPSKKENKGEPPSSFVCRMALKDFEKNRNKK